MCVSLLPPSQEKKRLQQEMSAVSSEEERQQLQREITFTEGSIQRWKPRIEQYQSEIKSREESLHRLEKEEEEGVLYHYSLKLHPIQLVMPSSRHMVRALSFGMCRYTSCGLYIVCSYTQYSTCTMYLPHFCVCKQF